MAAKQHRHDSNIQNMPGRQVLPVYLFITISILIFLVIFASLSFFFQSHNKGIWVIASLVIIIFLIAVYFFFQILFLTQLRQAAPVELFKPVNRFGNTPSSNEITYQTLLANPPAIDFETIVQLDGLVKSLYTNLARPKTSALVITGIAGVGKSTLASLIYHHAEKLRREGKGPFSAQALWLRLSGNTSIGDLAATIFTALGKPVPDLSKLAPENQAMTVFNAMKAIENPRLIVLDQLDNLLDAQTDYFLLSPGIEKWLDAVNNQQSNCPLLLTSRVWPLVICAYPPVYVQEYFYEGLKDKEGAELLQKQGVRASDDILQAIVESCGGHALALTLLASLLKKYNISFDELLEEQKETQVWSKEIARNLFDNIYLRQFNQALRIVLLGLAVYREPVPLEAVHTASASIFPSVSKPQMLKSIDLLLKQHVLQALAEGHYQLHPIIIKYMQIHLSASNERRNWQAAHSNAAKYYIQLAANWCPAQEERRRISDVRPLIEAVWHQCQAGLYKEAYDLMMREHLFVDVKRWGGSASLLELYQLLEKWPPKHLDAVQIYKGLGRIYRTLGNREQAVRYFEKALSIAEAEKDPWEKGRVIAFLGRTYADLGQKELAIQYYEEALKIRREGGNREGEGWTLDDLSLVYDDLGQFEQALKYGEQALEIRREIGDRRGEGRTLNTLGRVYDSIGQRLRALEYFQEALHILREVGDRGGEGAALNNLGLIFSKLEHREQVWKYYDEALHIFGEIGDRAGVSMTLYNLGLTYNEIGEKEEARKFLEKALSIRRDIGDRWGQSIVLDDLGKIYEELGQKEQASSYYSEALVLRRELKDRKGEGLALARLGGLDSSLGKKKAAQGHFEQALTLFRELGDREKIGSTLNELSRTISILGMLPQASVYLDEALSIFKELGDHEGISGTLNELGQISSEFGNYKEAEKRLKEALSLSREKGNLWEEANALNSLGVVYAHFGNNKRAQSYFEESLRFRREIGDRDGEAVTLSNLGRIFTAIGRYEDAFQNLEKSLRIFRDLGNRWREGRTLHSLGRVYLVLDDKEQARNYFEQALPMLQEVGDRREEAKVFNSLAMLSADQQPEMAIKLLEKALQINREVSDRKGEGWTLHNLGRVYMLLKQKDRAKDYFKQALIIRRAVGDRKGEGWTLHNIGLVYLEERHYDVALGCFLLTKAIFDKVNSPDYSKTQSCIEGLKQDIGEERFSSLQAEVEPQAYQIVKEALDEKV